jgi:endonuclease/exonuclease/phosphatase family metal-dependent hydrolase
MKILAWNVNHRTQRKPVPRGVIEVIAALAPDLVVLTEYVPSATHETVVEALGGLGLTETRLSVRAGKSNRVLVASRWRLMDGEIQAPEIHTCVPSNALHVCLPERGIEVLGMRVPDFSPQPAIRRACWDWLVQTAWDVASRPFVIIGDMNVDPKYPRARCGDRLAHIVDAGFTHASPPDGASFWTPSGHGVRIDHAFVSKHFSVTSAEYVTEAAGHLLVGRRDALSDHAALVVEIAA